MTALHFNIIGMRCASCAKKINDTLAKLAAVDNVNLNFATHSALVNTTRPATDIIQAIHQLGYDAEVVTHDHHHTDDSSQQLRNKTLYACLITLPLVIISMMDWLPNPTTIAGFISQLLLACACLSVMYYSAEQIYRSAWKQGIRNLSMDTLIALSTSVAWCYSMLVIFFPKLISISGQHVYFETVTVIIAFVNLGQWLEARAIKKTLSTLNALMDLQPQQARIIDEQGNEQLVAVDQIKIGDLLRIKPSEKIPVDGIVMLGQSYIDEAMFTGEPIAVSKLPGHKVHAGTINKSGTLMIKAEHIGDDTTLAQLVKLVQNAQHTKPNTGNLVDRIATVLVPAVILIALLSASIWLIFGPAPQWNYAFITAISVLVIACPCAIGLATPMAVIASLGRLAAQGILLRNADCLPKLTHINRIIFDKTGTLTRGQPSVTRFHAQHLAKENVLSLAASLAHESEHPLSHAILNYAEQEKIILLKVTEFESTVGCGVEGKINNHRFRLGQLDWLLKQGITAQADLRAQGEFYAHQGESLVYVSCDSELVGLFCINDLVKNDAFAVIDTLTTRGIKVTLITGDNALTAKSIANELNIQEVYAAQSPADKLTRLKAWQAAGEMVAMVGDGSNDAPALAQADVGIALSTGTDLAIASADVTILGQSLQHLITLFSLSHATVSNIRQNLTLAFAYNILALPIAAGALYPLTHMLLNPMIAALTMALSSLSVVGNALRLGIKKFSFQ